MAGKYKKEDLSLDLAEYKVILFHILPRDWKWCSFFGD